jgi:hypothetical protein
MTSVKNLSCRICGNKYDLPVCKQRLFSHEQCEFFGCYGGELLGDSFVSVQALTCIALSLAYLNSC